MASHPPSREEILAAFQKQADWCAQLGSPFTAGLLARLIESIAVQGPAADLVGAWPSDPVADALALRLCAGLHALVLNGEVPDLAAHYPPNPAPDRSQFAQALNTVLTLHQDALRESLKSAPQTNEVGRSAVLLGGFLTIAQATQLPLRLLELGASAGLNMLCDHYQYQLGETPWGNPESPVRLAPRWRGNPPPCVPLNIHSRAGCDLAPIDIADDTVALRLRAYIWPDQQERLARMQAAIGLARTQGPKVDCADAADWLRGELLYQLPSTATVVYHSIMWQYMPVTSQAEIQNMLHGAGESATTQTPLAWLRFEPPHPEAPPELHLTMWPGALQHRLAIAHPHGTGVHWLH